MSGRIARSGVLDSLLNAVNCYYEKVELPKTEEDMIRLRRLMDAIIDNEGREMED